MLPNALPASRCMVLATFAVFPCSTASTPRSEAGGDICTVRDDSWGSSPSSSFRAGAAPVLLYAPVGLPTLGQVLSSGTRTVHGLFQRLVNLGVAGGRLPRRGPSSVPPLGATGVCPSGALSFNRCGSLAVLQDPASAVGCVRLVAFAHFRSPAASTPAGVTRSDVRTVRDGFGLPCSLLLVR